MPLAELKVAFVFAAGCGQDDRAPNVLARILNSAVKAQANYFHRLPPVLRVWQPFANITLMQLTDLNWYQVQALSKDTPVVFPIAALEQHGGHMPLFTDSMLLGEIIRRVSERVGNRALFAPLMWLGNSDHHLDFPHKWTNC